jgi:hypothetical protein
VHRIPSHNTGAAHYGALYYAFASKKMQALHPAIFAKLTERSTLTDCAHSERMQVSASW